MRADRFVLCLLAVAALAAAPVARSTNRSPRSIRRQATTVPPAPAAPEQTTRHTLFILAFSGGGTRAAAFSYGVLRNCGAPRSSSTASAAGWSTRSISRPALSGGVSRRSPTRSTARGCSPSTRAGSSAQRAGRADRRALNPFNWPKAHGQRGRSELAADYYDKILFEARPSATCSTSRRRSPSRPAPTSRPDRARFHSERLRLALLDLSRVRLVARGSRVLGGAGSPVASDSQQLWRHLRLSVPVLGRRRCQTPGQRMVGGAHGRSATARWRPSRTARTARSSISWTGAVADNLGLRPVLEMFEELAVERAIPRGRGFGRHPQDRGDRRERPLGEDARLGSPRVALLVCHSAAGHQRADRPLFVRIRREHEGPPGDPFRAARAADCAGRLAGATEAEAEASVSVRSSA